MTKFIASVARRLAEVGDYVDSLDAETRAAQRAAARIMSDQASRNLREIARAMDAERGSIPFSTAVQLAKVQHAEARTSRRRDRARARAQKELMRGDLFA